MINYTKIFFEQFKHFLKVCIMRITELFVQFSADWGPINYNRDCFKSQTMIRKCSHLKRHCDLDTNVLWYVFLTLERDIAQIIILGLLRALSGFSSPLQWPHVFEVWTWKSSSGSLQSSYGTSVKAFLLDSPKAFALTYNEISSQSLECISYPARSGLIWSWRLFFPTWRQIW